MRGRKSSGPVQRKFVESSRTSPSPSASVDLAHLGPRPRCEFVHSRHTSPEPEAEGESSRGLVKQPRVDASVTVTLNHLSGIIRSSLDVASNPGTKGRPIQFGDGRYGAAVGLRYEVVRWSSRPQGTACLPLTHLLMIRSLAHSSAIRCLLRRHTAALPAPTSGRRLADLRQVVVLAVAEHRVHHAQQPTRACHDRLLATRSLLDPLIDPFPRRQLWRITRHAASTNAHRKSGEPALVIGRSLDPCRRFDALPGASPA